MSWKLFVGASILSAGLLIKIGAPLVPIALGIAGAAFVNRWRQRSATAKRCRPCSSHALAHRSPAAHDR